jgi:hypothetical protein
MSQFEWSLSEDKHQILSRDGRLLCSPRNPVKEAIDWVDRNRTLIEAANAVAVVGIGAGHHIQFLEESYPQKKLLVFDIDSKFSFINKNFKSEVVLGIDADHLRASNAEFFGQWPVVLAFRPAFQPMERQYVHFWMKLAQRDQSTTEKLMSGRGYESAEEAKIWLCLREFVK